MRGGVRWGTYALKYDWLILLGLAQKVERIIY